MRKKKKKTNIFIIPIVVILSVVVIYFGSDLLAIYKLGLTEVYVASSSIPQRTILDSSLLEMKEVPKAYVDENVCTNLSQIEGKYVKLNSYIPKGSLIYKEALDDIDNMKDNVHMELRKDEITYDLFVRDIKVNPAHLLKGMNADLYLTINRKEIVSDLFISDIRIIGLYDVNNKEIKDYDHESTLGTISIAVKRNMVPYLNKAIAIGEVNLLVSSKLYEENSPSMNETSIIFDYLK